MKASVELTKDHAYVIGHPRRVRDAGVLTNDLATTAESEV